VSGEDPAPPETSVLFDVFALGQAVGRLLATAMRDSPLTPTEYAVYSAVFELEAATPTQLAARLGMRLTTCVDRLRVLESRGHARRVPHPTDGRSYKVVLTAPGREAHLAANRRFEDADRAIRSHLREPATEGAAQASLRAIRMAADAAMGELRESASPRQWVGRAG
jgi:DNA-binding MarR family transcriptional regulator